MEKKIILTVGASSSGKSMWAEDFVKNNEHWVNLNRDDVRFKLFTNGERDWSRYKFNNANENTVTEWIEDIANQTVRDNESIIVSDTNLNPKIRNRWKLFAEKHSYDYEEKPFIVDWETLRKRNSQRYGGLSENLLWDQYLRMNEYLGRKTYEPDTSKKSAVIIDIDGTLCSMEGVRKPFDWDKVHLDLPRRLIISMVQGIIEDGYEPVFLSGRDGSCKDSTYKWIEDYVTGVGFGFHLFMREAGDMRKDYIVKEELFWKYVAHNFNVVGVIDDRPQVLRMWEELKIPNIINVGGSLYKEF